MITSIPQLKKAAAQPKIEGIPIMKPNAEQPKVPESKPGSKPNAPDRKDGGLETRAPYAYKLSQ